MWGGYDEEQTQGTWGDLRGGGEQKQHRSDREEKASSGRRRRAGWGVDDDNGEDASRRASQIPATRHIIIRSRSGEGTPPHRAHFAVPSPGLHEQIRECSEPEGRCHLNPYL